MYEKKDSEQVESTLETVENGLEKEAKELFQIDIENEARGIHVHIQAEDSGDAVFMAGFVISGFRKLGLECKSKAIL